MGRAGRPTVHAAPPRRGGAPSLLPGGLLTDAGLARDYTFRPADGHLELALAEVAGRAANTPQAVTLALVAALDSVAGGAPTCERVDALCVPDRQFLMRELARHLGDEGGWQVGHCARCAARFDFFLALADLPVTPAAAGFPRLAVRLGGRRLALRLPDGADQQRVLGAAPARRKAALLAAVIVDAQAGQLAAELNEADVERVEQALEAGAPKVVCQAAIDCPECGHGNVVPLDPYAVLARHDGGLLGEVHRIASHYHWGEDQILSLPWARRQRYLQLIDQSRGLVG